MKHQLGSANPGSGVIPAHMARPSLAPRGPASGEIHAEVLPPLPRKPVRLPDPAVGVTSASDPREQLVAQLNASLRHNHHLEAKLM